MIDQFGLSKYCIIRTYSAGVHCGELVERSGTQVILRNARRIWYWEGAFTLNAIANNGASENSKLSQAVDQILITEAIEILICEEKSANWLKNKAAYSND